MTDYRLERIKRMIQEEDRVIKRELAEVTVGPQLIEAEARKKCLEDVRAQLVDACKRCQKCP